VNPIGSRREVDYCTAHIGNMLDRTKGCRGNPRDLRQGRGTSALFIDPVGWMMEADLALLSMCFPSFPLSGICFKALG
jgi:hypothetical protein